MYFMGLTIDRRLRDPIGVLTATSITGSTCRSKKETMIRLVSGSEGYIFTTSLELIITSLEMINPITSS